MACLCLSFHHHHCYLQVNYTCNVSLPCLPQLVYGLAWSGQGCLSCVHTTITECVTYIHVQVPQTSPSLPPPLPPTHLRASTPAPVPAFGPARVTPSKPPLGLGAQAGAPTTHKTSSTPCLARTTSDNPSLDDFEGASASVLRKWGMLKETEEDTGSSEEGDDVLVSLLDSAADLRAQPAEGKGVPISGVQTPDKPVHELMPSPCMPSPGKATPSPRPATPKQTSAASPSKKKHGMAWICCKASPTKPDFEEPASRVPAERDQAAPSVEQLPNGDSYRGQYVEDVRQGHAVYRFANGDVYQGQFGQDCMQGSGVYTFANEGRYSGQVKLLPECSVGAL